MCSQNCPQPVLLQTWIAYISNHDLIQRKMSPFTCSHSHECSHISLILFPNYFKVQIKAKKALGRQTKLKSKLMELKKDQNDDIFYEGLVTFGIIYSH